MTSDSVSSTTTAPDYRFITTADPPTAELIIGLYQSAGWWSAPQDNAQLLTRIIRGSHCFLIARHASQVIGMGRAISDAASDAYIQDVCVHPAWRRRGVGHEIVKRLAARLVADGIQWIGLIAENNTQDFYTPLGFEPMTNAFPMLKLIS